MFRIFIFIFVFSQILCAITLKQAQKKLEENKNIQNLNFDISISKSNENLSSKWANPTFGFGANDLTVGDYSTRDKEAMQTQFVTLSQNIPMGDKLKIGTKISSIQSKINQLLKDDKILKYKALLSGYFDKYKIIQNKIELYDKYQKNISDIKKIHILLFQNDNSKQIDILNAQIKHSSLQIKKNKLKYQLDNIKYDISTILFENIVSLNHSLDAINHSNIDIDDVLNTHPFIMVFDEKIKQSKQKISFENAKKFDSIKVSLGYYQREVFDDYLAFSINSAVPLYGSENIKATQAKIRVLKQNNELENIKNEFRFTIKKLELKRDISYKNYSTYMGKITKQKKLISEILKSQSSIRGITSIKVIQNQNAIIAQELLGLDELQLYYEASSKLRYFKGKTL